MVFESFPNSLNWKLIQSLQRVSVKQSNDGVNGESIGHYRKGNDEYTIKVKLVNGRRQGEAEVLKNGKPNIRMEYDYGFLNGKINIVDEYGNVELIGRMVYEREHGLFKIYENSVRVWVGYFVKGKAYSELTECSFLKGYYMERRLEDDSILSIAQYDDALTDKNGYCIQCVDGKMTVCYFENGVRMTLAPGSDERFGVMEQRKRDFPGEESETGSKRVCIDPWHTPIEDSFLEYDKRKHYEYGVWREKEKCYALKQSKHEIRLIEGDLNNHEMKLYENGELKGIISGKDDCIDLDASGRRWEGGVKDGKPFGYGILYDEEGKKEYEGFVMDEMKCLYGMEYFDDIERVNYAGCYLYGKRFGKGVAYDRNGDVEYDGVWKENEQYSHKQDKSFFDNKMESLEIDSSRHMNTTSFVLPSFLQLLKRIVIGDKCFVPIRLFTLKDLSQLESLVIGYNCFTSDNCPVVTTDDSADSDNDDDSEDDNRHAASDISMCHRKRTDGDFQIMNCPKLKTICIQSKSFSDYNSFAIGNLPSLQSIQLDEYCFMFCSLFALTGLIGMRLVNRFSSSSISSVRELHIHMLPVRCS